VPALWGRLQPRSWRTWLLLVLALPALLAVYTLLLIPFTPSIADITKAKTERPAQLLSVDGKVLAEQPVLALNAVGEAGVFGRLVDSVKLWFN